MTETRTIPKDISAEFGKDYHWLRQEGLKYIEQLASGLWTDYNTHDPGITILEMLAYAITDLGYRLSKAVEDILAVKEDNQAEMHRQFLSAIHALPMAPVTESDYRELFVRIRGVKNAWLKDSTQNIVANFKNQPPQLRYEKENYSPSAGKEKMFSLDGIYNILIDFEEAPPELPPNNASAQEKAIYEARHKAFTQKRKEIYEKIRSVYHYFRGLCEDVDKIGPVTEEPVVICAEIELQPAADPEQVEAGIILGINDYLSPPLHFYSLQEMVADHRPAGEIFDGPVFDFSSLEGFHPDGRHPFDRKGFLKKEELANSELRKEIRLSDIIGVIMKVDGVKLVKKIAFGFCSSKINNGDAVLESIDSDQWILCISGDRSVKPALCRENSVFRFFRDVIPVITKKEETETILRKMIRDRERAIEEKTTEDLRIPVGTYMETGAYTTIQNQFPENYGIGQTGLPDTATTERKALAKQLKGYLLFFDQILADYFSQLEKAGHLLSTCYSDHQTYFGNLVDGLKDIESIFPDSHHWIETHDALLKETGLDNYTERKNRFLDHLLARFAEQFNEYVLLLYSVYGKEASRAVIRYKTTFLNDLQEISLRRGCGFDYFNKKTVALESLNVTGLEKRVARLLGFPDYAHRLNRKLPYTVFPVQDALQKTRYTWEIRKEGQVILCGSGHHEQETNGWQELGRAALACRSRQFYNTWYSDDKKLVSFYITDHVLTENEGSGDSSITFAVADGKVDPGDLRNLRPHVVAYHPLCYPASPDPGAGTANEIAEQNISGFIDFFTRDFIFEEKLYEIFNVSVDPLHRSWNWRILQDGAAVLEGAAVYRTRQDAQDAVRRAAVLGCDQENYQVRVDPDKKSLSVEVVDGSKKSVARLSVKFPATDLKPATGTSVEVKDAIESIMNYLLTGFNQEEIWVVEHILLRPDRHALSKIVSPENHFMPVCIDPNGISCPPADPYSYRISVVLPGYTLRLRDPGYRKFVERLIRLETPAHILPRICFVPHHAMVCFRTRYHAWRKELQDFTSEQRKEQAAMDLIRCLTELYTVYEEGQLIDCDDDTIERNPMVLDRTHLGSL